MPSGARVRRTRTTTCRRTSACTTSSRSVESSRPVREPTALDDRRVRALAAEEFHARLRGIPEAVAGPLISAQATSKLGGLAAAYPDAAVELVLVDGAAAGYVVTASADDGIRLCDIVVAEASRGTGVGRAMLAGVVERADADGAAVTLSVWHDAAARAWYARHGFVVCGGDPQGHVEMRREYPGIHSVA
ncbi:MAG: GNAT family N-acetyltransferase [Microbacterium sp.]|nr:GNAT family N-acetyltransferase [Microbacterium sp.]